MAAHHIGQRGAQRVDVQCSTDSKRCRHVVNRGGPLQLVKEPQPGLGKRQWNHRRPMAGHQGLQPSPAGTDAGRQLGHRGRLKDSAHRKTGIQAGVDRGNQAHRRQRIPTQIEKRVIHADALHTQHPGVDAGQDLLGEGGRGAAVTGVLVLRCRQGPFVEFAVDRQRQRRQHHHRGRNHVPRQLLG